VLLSSSTNALDSLITGVTIDLNSVGEQPVNITITRDTAAIETAVGDFVKAFNDLVDRIDTHTRYVPDTNTRGPLLGDSTAITLRGALFNTVQSDGIGLSGTFEELADVGVAIGSGGELRLDRDRLRAALEEDAQAVADLFAARVLKPKEPIQVSSGITATDPDAKDEFLTLGVAGMLEELGKSYTASVDGILSGRNRTLTDQIQAQNRRITAFDERLEVRRQVLQRQFLAMERAIGQLQSQQGALSQISMVG
jgi:flagellar hook-associated protein 2